MQLGAIPPITDQEQPSASTKAASAQTSLPEATDTDRPGADYVTTLKKYAPYIIGAAVLYYIFYKK